ncbi:hypothetical protein B0H17DRAFT_1149663 [Mycena rosella]|uniref:Uncharacterized protein n=1 Tax=Mycena rosella TaxID=1033263 RepID=A0AAD7C0M2_MYCRO|nr:hypothetical protein B0H17DRAFT_1149663 [Mycena rosella]
MVSVPRINTRCEEHTRSRLRELTLLKLAPRPRGLTVVDIGASIGNIHERVERATLWSGGPSRIFVTESTYISDDNSGCSRMRSYNTQAVHGLRSDVTSRTTTWGAHAYEAIAGPRRGFKDTNTSKKLDENFI